MSKKILIVDDEEQIRDIFETILKIFYRQEIKDGSIVVFKAADGTEAVEMFDKARPDFVLMDVSMPRMDGIDAFYRMKEVDIAHPVRVFFITGFASDGVIGKRMDKAISDGALGVLSKPVSSNDIKQLVDQYLIQLAS